MQEHKAAEEAPASGELKSSSVEENALAPLVSAFSDKAEDMGTSKDMPLFDTTWTTARVKQLGGHGCPPITKELLALYFDFMTRVGYLPAAVKSPGAHPDASTGSMLPAAADKSKAKAKPKEAQSVDDDDVFAID